jgi:hypothetical protein
MTTLLFSLCVGAIVLGAFFFARYLQKSGMNQSDFHRVQGND